MKLTDTYKTITTASEEVLLKEKKSKFYGFAFPVQNPDEVKLQIEALKKQFPTANHVCYAWQIGIDQPSYRTNDDGEPNNSAGMPIYGQIQSFELTNILIAVVRYFGGTKLGVGGLISAYKNTAKLSIEHASIVVKIIEARLLLKFDYAEMDVVMRFLKKKQLKLISQTLNLDCEILIAVRKSELNIILENLKKLHKIKVSILE